MHWEFAQSFHAAIKIAREMKSLVRLKDWATRLRQEIYAIYLAQKDPRVPWYAKVLAACVVGYALSPIDLIPDPIPVLGYLDDLLLLPLGVALVVKLIPTDVLEECRKKARQTPEHEQPRRRVAAGIIISLWAFLFVFAVMFLVRTFSN